MEEVKRNLLTRGSGLWALAFAVFFSISVVEAAETTSLSVKSGMVPGTLRNAAGQPQAGVVLRVVDADGEVVAKTMTGTQGKFIFTRMPVGEYSLVIGDGSPTPLTVSPDAEASTLNLVVPESVPTPVLPVAPPPGGAAPGAAPPGGTPAAGGPASESAAGAAGTAEFLGVSAAAWAVIGTAVGVSITIATVALVNADCAWRQARSARRDLRELRVSP